MHCLANACKISLSEGFKTQLHVKHIIVTNQGRNSMDCSDCGQTPPWQDGNEKVLCLCVNPVGAQGSQMTFSCLIAAGRILVSVCRGEHLPESRHLAVRAPHGTAHTHQLWGHLLTTLTHSHHGSGALSVLLFHPSSPCSPTSWEKKKTSFIGKA